MYEACRDVALLAGKSSTPSLNKAQSNCKKEIYNTITAFRPRGLRHDLSSPARTLGSCVRIPLEACVSVCIYSVFVLYRVYVTALRRADTPYKESYRLCIDKVKEDEMKNWRRLKKTLKSHG
jgi:hypothetical protein